MKTKCYTPGWSVGILVAMSLGILTWYGVGWWLEPKPLWIRSNDYLERNFIPYGYEQDRKLLVGIEYGIEQDDGKGNMATVAYYAERRITDPGTWQW